ncbi:hypothetical protein BaRGS_00012982 [Batillaria attramentaria]|uniref:PDZ domain-containing protein n=1 Tax=Batillaria attramentaria TaxID=370345 RepID=A0ABD0L9D9_9CAEN
MATLRSRATDISHYRTQTSNTRRLQEGLYTHLDEQEKSAFIEVLNTYGVRKDIFELVNSLRKILNTPVKRQLFPLVRGVLRKSDIEAFDLLTKGGKSYGTLPRPFLYRPHAADISVLRKHRSNTLNRFNEISHKRRASSLVSELSDREADFPGVRDIRKVYIETRDGNYDGFGFNIRGGSEYGLGVYVSSVDEGGPAEIQGLQVGDLIVEANDISFQKISHGEAARIIRAANRLELSVCRVGRIPGAHTVHETYKWVDSRGRPVSPPPDLFSAGHVMDDADTRSRSSLNLLKGSDERKVNVVVERGHSLGLMVRGGREYGLGVYISGVDPYSVAENAGLKVGDQILDVNGQSLMGVSHSEAVRILTRSRHMVLTIRDVGRVPYAKTTIDRTQWVSKNDTHSLHSGRYAGRRSVSEPDLTATSTGFSRGAGSQLMWSAMPMRSQHDVLEDQARVLLNNEEQATLRYYLAEYSRNNIRVPGLVSALVELLNTGAKFTLMAEIRTLIQPKDLDLFDSILRKHQYQGHSPQGILGKAVDPDSISLLSGDSADAFMDDTQKRTLFSTKIKPVMKPKMMEALTINIPSTSKHKSSSERDFTPNNLSVDHSDAMTVSPSENGARSKNGPVLTKPVPFTRGQARRVKKSSRPSPNAAVFNASPGTSGAYASASGHLSSRVTYTRAEVHPRGKGILRKWRRKCTLAHVRFSDGSHFIATTPQFVLASRARVLAHADDPSDDSGVEVNNPQPLDPRSLLDGVTISKAGPVDIDTAVARQQGTDAHLLTTDQSTSASRRTPSPLSHIDYINPTSNKKNVALICHHEKTKDIKAVRFCACQEHQNSSHDTLQSRVMNVILKMQHMCSEASSARKCPFTMTGDS